MTNRRGLLKSLGVALLSSSAVLLWREQLYHWRKNRPPTVVRRRERRPAPLPERRKATEAERQGAITTIRAQLDAFRRNDYERAATFQSSKLKQNFSTSREFRRMMEANYPQFAHSRNVEFLEAVAAPDGEIVDIVVAVVGEDSIRVRAAFAMRLEDGAYRVDGVNGGFPPRRPPEPGEVL